jgi:hypothetical protein
MPPGPALQDVQGAEMAGAEGGDYHFGGFYWLWGYTAGYRVVLDGVQVLEPVDHFYFFPR